MPKSTNPPQWLIDIPHYRKEVDLRREEFVEITRTGSWRETANQIIEKVKTDSELQQSFHTYWTEAGHRIRQQFDDDRLLAELLRKILPTYTGDDIELYRGENLFRWESKRVGLCWSSKLETAKRFASGLNATAGGGVILKSMASKLAIIAAPSPHSKWLDEYEYTLDPHMLEKIVEVERFRCSD